MAPSGNDIRRIYPSGIIVGGIVVSTKIFWRSVRVLRNERGQPYRNMNDMAESELSIRTADCMLSALKRSALASVRCNCGH